MPIKLTDFVKLNQIIERIQSANFDANDVENLLIKLRPYSGNFNVFLEVAHFVAHPDARDRGLAQKTMTAFFDSIQFYLDYISPKKPLDIQQPFPLYIYRLLLSQSQLTDEEHLKKFHRMSRSSLRKKIESNFAIDKKLGSCKRRTEKIGVELINALELILSQIHSKPAFHINDFHRELKNLMHEQNLKFDEKIWIQQEDRITLSILCLISNTDFILENGSTAKCRLTAQKNHIPITLEDIPNTSNNVKDFGTFGFLEVLGESEIPMHTGQLITFSFPLIETNLDPLQHCHDHLFKIEETQNKEHKTMQKTIYWERDMSLDENFKLIPTSSLI